MSSRLVQTTVAPTGTVIVCGPKLKLSIFTSAAAALSLLAMTFGDPAHSNNIAIITGAVKLAIHMFLFVIFLLPFHSLTC
jgi:hypothetical protein